MTLILYYVAFMIGGAFAAYFPSHNFGRAVILECGLKPRDELDFGHGFITASPRTSRRNENV